MIPFTKELYGPFAASFTDELIRQLEQVNHLSVASMPRHSFIGPPLDRQSFIEKLKVNARLTGTVKKVGENFTLDVSLVDAATGQLLWSEKYARGIRHLFEVEAEVVSCVAATLGLEVNESHDQPLQLEGTGSPQ